jgi:hypothetical protein
MIQFNGNVGPKTNNEVSTDINKMVKPAVDSLQDSIISVLKEHIDKLNNKINSTYAETLETIGIYTERRGEAILCHFHFIPGLLAAHNFKVII